MPTNALIKLERLECIREDDTYQNANPYIWPILLWTHDGVLASRELVGLTTPTAGNERVIIKEGMRLGEIADIPASVGLLSTRFDSSSTVRRLILAIAFLEKDKAPDAIIQTGFQAFSNALRTAAADNLVALVKADQIEDENERKVELNTIIETMTPGVVNQVKSAIEKSLTSWQKTRVLAGTLKLDNFIGCDFVNFSDPLSKTTNWTFRPRFANAYEIQGRLELNPVYTDTSETLINISTTDNSESQ
jgi:hypothetical protein